MSDEKHSSSNEFPGFTQSGTDNHAGSNPTLGVSDETTGVKAPSPASAPNLSEILAYAFWMRKQGYRPSAIKAAISVFKAVENR